MKNFDDMLAKDREFTVGGETFHWRDVRPEVLTSFEPSEGGGYDNRRLLLYRLRLYHFCLQKLTG